MATKIYLNEVDEVLRLAPDQLTVSIVGFGYIGTCIGALLASRGIKVIGIDTNESVISEINSGATSIEEPGLANYVKQGHESGTLRATTLYEPISASDFVIITVGTPLDDNHSPDLGPLMSACASIGKMLQEGCVVMIKSTVPPGSTEGWVKSVLEKASGLKAGENFGLVFSPERISEGNALQELERTPIVIGGVSGRCSEIAAQFWHRALGVETITVSSPSTAEMVKLADNQWIDLNVALANEVALMSDRLNIDAFEVIKAANSLPKGQHLVNILAPSMGVGGYCLPKDPWFFHKIGMDNGLDLQTPVCSRSVNDLMPEFSFRLVQECVRKSGIELRDAKIAVLGLAYKNNTGDVRSTPVAPFLRLLEQVGCALTVFDPLVNEENTRRVTSAPVGNDIYSTVAGADMVACLAAHQEFRDVPLNALKARTNHPCWFFDGRHGFDIQTVKNSGFLYTGIGCACHSG